MITNEPIGVNKMTLTEKINEKFNFIRHRFDHISSGAYIFISLCFFFIILVIFIYLSDTELSTTVVNKSQVIGSTLAFGAFILATVIAIWQVFVSRQDTTLGRTLSLWGAHRSDSTFRSKRNNVKKHCNTESDILQLLKDNNTDVIYDIQDFCNFYERLGRGIRKSYYPCRSELSI
jgi:hypothetical protein